MATDVSKAKPVADNFDAEARARGIATAFGKEASLPAPQIEKLQKLIVEAVGERLSEVGDIRLGRVLGAALAAL